MFLGPEELTQLEHQYTQYSSNPQANATVTIGGYPVSRYAVIEEERRVSIAPACSGAPALVKLVPQILAWAEADSFLEMMCGLDYQVATIRLRQALHDIEQLDSDVATAIRSSLETLPTWAQTRFKIAPAIRRRLELWRNDPATHVAFLCRALKAELRLSGEKVRGEGYWTALGDFFVTDPAADVSHEHGNLRAPRLQQLVPVDGVSPNLRDIDSPPLAYESHSPEELATAARTLENVMELADHAARGAAQIIRRFVKAIVLLRTGSGGVGSSSHYTSPGQVVLRNSHMASVATIASGLVHEAIHQVLYIVEGGERFVDSRGIPARSSLESPWTSRKLPIHSYLHACFVWYGLARFWSRTVRSNCLPAESSTAQLHEALLGFRSGNPADRLFPHRHAIGEDALEAVASLRDELQKAGDLDLCPVTTRSSSMPLTAAPATP